LFIQLKSTKFAETKNKTMQTFYKLCFSLLFTGIFSSALFAQMRGPEEEPYVPGELIVQIDRNVDLYKVIETLPEQFGFTVVQELSPFMRAWLLSFDFQTINQMDALRMVQVLPGITIAQNNHYVEIRQVPNDPQFSQQWHHLNDGSGGGTADADIDTDEAWEITTGGTNALGHDIVVCILEGVDFSHVDLIDNHWTNPHEIPGNGIDDDGNGYIDDINGWNTQTNTGAVAGGSTSHGTNVAGMIGAKGNNSVGVVGANWNVKMMNVRGYSASNEASVVAAYNYPLSLRKRYNETNGASGAFVVATNASWGIDGANPNNYPIWCGFYDTLGVHGILNCGATTNSNLNVDVSGDMPTACPSPYMVGVGRSDRNDNFAGGYGLNTINFVAPGINVRTTANGNAYTTTTGTSFASPLTAGVIALLYAIPCESFMNIVMSNPQQGADLVLNAMMTGVDQKPQLANFFITGGRINAKNSMDILMAETCNSCITPALAPASNVVETSATINFNLVDDATTYTFFYRPEGSTTWTEMSVTSSPINLTGLVACTTYEYYINAICPEENSNNSQVLTFRTKGCGACIDLEYCEASTTENPTPRFAIHSPSNLSTIITNYTVTADWGGSLETGYAYGNLVLVNDGSANPQLGCSALTNGVAIAGNIAVAERGTCNFSSKALNAQNAGATALIIINNQTQAPTTLGAGAESASITIPVVMISQTQGAALMTALQNGETVVGLLGSQNEWIQSFQMAGETFTTGNDNGYNGPIETQIELWTGSSYDFVMTPGFAGQPLPEYTRVWMDLNQNGQFESNELVYDQGAASLGAVNGSFTVPMNAQAGLSRVRVQMAYQGFGASALPGTCGSFQSGETEDYCVTVRASNVSVEEIEGVSVTMFPNPSAGNLNIVSNANEALNIQVVSLSGQVIANHKMNSASMLIDLTGLADGVYMVHIVSLSGAIIQVQKLVIAKQ
jgi:hypothetical protein